MRTLKQVNEYFSNTGYEVARVNGVVEVSFEGNCVWTFRKGCTVPQVVEAMTEMVWLVLYNKTCELPEVNDNSEPVITKSQALELGFCFQYHTSDIQVYRPDGTSFYANDIEQALGWISDGTHLGAYAEPPYCGIVITPLLSGTVPSPVSYWSEPDATSMSQAEKDKLTLISQGYNPDTCYIDKAGNVRLFYGDSCIGTILEQRW